MSHPILPGFVRRRGPLAALLIAASCTAVACGDSEKRASPSEPVNGAESPSERRASSTPARTPDVALGEMVTVAGGGKELGDGGPATAAGFCAERSEIFMATPCRQPGAACFDAAEGRSA